MRLRLFVRTMSFSRNLIFHVHTHVYIYTYICVRICTHIYVLIYSITCYSLYTHLYCSKTVCVFFLCAHGAILQCIFRDVAQKNLSGSYMINIIVKYLYTAINNIDRLYNVYIDINITSVSAQYIASIIPIMQEPPQPSNPPILYCNNFNDISRRILSQNIIIVSWSDSDSE